MSYSNKKNKKWLKTIYMRHRIRLAKDKEKEHLKINEKENFDFFMSNIEGIKFTKKISQGIILINNKVHRCKCPIHSQKYFLRIRMLK